MQFKLWMKTGGLSALAIMLGTTAPQALAAQDGGWDSAATGNQRAMEIDTGAGEEYRPVPQPRIEQRRAPASQPQPQQAAQRGRQDRPDRAVEMPRQSRGQDRAVPGARGRTGVDQPDVSYGDPRARGDRRDRGRDGDRRWDGRDADWNGRDQRGRDWNRGERDQREWDGDRRDRRDRDWNRRDGDQRDWDRDRRDRRDRDWNRRDRDRNWDQRGWRDRDQRDWRERDQRQWRNERRDYRRWDRRGWRNDRRYDWQRYRVANRRLYTLGRYYAPYRDHSYRRFNIGFTISNVFFGSRYWISDPWRYRLPTVYGPYRWVRYYDDVLLVDTYSGEVVDVIYDFFW